MLEFAIVLPILLMLVLGIIEMGRVMMLNQVTTNACREACRRAIIPGMSHQAVVDVVNGYLDAGGVSDTGRVVSIVGQDGSAVVVDDVLSHQPVSVVVSVPYSENTWGFTAIMGGKNLVSRSTMRRE